MVPAVSHRLSALAGRVSGQTVIQKGFCLTPYRSVDFLRERHIELQLTQFLARDRTTSSASRRAEIRAWIQPHSCAGEVLRSAPNFIVEAGCGVAPPSGSQRLGEVNNTL